MAEPDRTAGQRRGTRRGPDPLALLVGLAALGVTGTGFAGLLPQAGFDLRWILAVVAVVAGTVFLLAGLRNSGKDRDE